MFAPTGNYYQFQYLKTGITGPGIEKAYLPEVPPEDQIYFKEEQKWTRPVMPEYLRKASKEWYLKSDPENKKGYDPDFVSPYMNEIIEWEDFHWKITEEGMWFWNNGKPTYLTPFYVWYLTAWDTSFGYPEFRVTDLEITYWIAFWENDPNSFGGMLNTIRRYGKSAIMGGWLMYRTSRNYKHNGGMQGENDDKIFSFYNTHILQPFYKLPQYFKPKYDTGSKQTEGVKFYVPPRRGRQFDAEEIDVLESEIDHRVSKEGAYDQAKLESYLMEEPGKTLVANVSDRWDFVKPCLKRGIFIRGKAFMGTTVEFMETRGRGGKAYQKMYFASDYNHRGPDGRTKTGLYAAFLPGDCALEGFFDEWGFPMREQAKKYILDERKANEDNPKDYSAIIRKYPLYLHEIFYVNAENCEFNATILQERLTELTMLGDDNLSTIEFFWENNIRFSKVRWRHNPRNGWAKTAWMPTDPDKEANLVDIRLFGGVSNYAPKNIGKFDIGIDPIDHGHVTTDKIASSSEFVSSRRSRPVLFVKRRYDLNIDGPLTQDILEQRAKDKFQYQTGTYCLMMDVRPGDPNVLFERVLMICWFFGSPINVESAKPGVINYLQQNHCGLFILPKYQPVVDTKRKISSASEDGTPANTMTISEYTSALATMIEYFGHTIPFKELVSDLLVFNPGDTRDFDYSVAAGWTELAQKISPKVKVAKPIDLDDFMTAFNSRGEVINRR